MAEPIDYSSPGAARGTPLPRIGGVLAMAGTFIGTFIFLLACFGFSAAFALSPLPIILGSIGLVLCLSGLFFKHIDAEDSHVVAGLLVNVAVIVGGLLELWAMLNFPKSTGP